jgi:hypothetical protein
MLSKKSSIVFLVGIAVLIAVIGLLIDPIPQPQTYHSFADQRNWFGVANAWNVLSNIPFALVGIWGLFLLFCNDRLQFVDNRERRLWAGVSIGFILTAIGSGYYHLAPDNTRLAWDRLPMTMIFMSYVAALISERINVRFGLCLWPVLLGIGFYSVFYWHSSELQGAGDLRFYFGVQAFAILATLVMLLTPSPYDRNWDLAVVAVLFVLAKFFEMFDHQFDVFTGGFFSGHTIKHLVSVLAGIWLLRMLWKRKIIQNLKREL